MAPPLNPEPELQAANFRYYDDLFESDPAAITRERENFRRTLKLSHPMERTVKLTREAVDVENRTVTFSLSSETPVERWFGMEVLGHGPGEIDESRIQNSAPYLMDHNMRSQVGAIQSFGVTNGRSTVTAKISRSPQGEQLLQDHADGIRVHSSVGYTVQEFKDVTPKDADRNAPPIYRAVKWTPYEASSVALGADSSVGVGRSFAPHIPATTQKETRTMPEETPEQRIARETLANQATENERVRQAGVVSAAASTAMQTERTRVASITKTAEMAIFSGNAPVAELSRKAIVEGMDAGTFNLEALEIIGKAQRVVPSSDSRELNLGMPDKDMARYSIRKAIVSQMTGGKLDGVELEAQQEMEKRGMTSKHGGALVPYQGLTLGARANRALTASVFGGGGALVSTQPQEFVDILRNKTMVLSSGAQMVSGLKGDIYFPRQTGASTMYWITDGQALTESDSSFGQIHLAPNTGGAVTEFSRQLLIQADPSIEAVISNDLMSVIAIGLDNAALNGSGTAGQPLGLFNFNGIGSQSISSCTYANLIAFETKVAQANADVNSMRWLANPAARGLLKGRTQVSGGTAPPFMWDKDNTINGYGAAVTNQVSSGNMAFGDWSQLILANWGPGIELKLVENGVNYRAGNMELIAFVSADNAVRQVGAFCVGTNLS